MRFVKVLIGVLFLVIANFSMAQKTSDTLPAKVTLQQCITYALANQDIVKQSQLDEDITRRNIRIAMSGWYPQVEADGYVQHFIQIPITEYPNLNNPPSYTPYVILPSATNYVSAGTFSVNQMLYSNSLFFAARTSKTIKTQASENTESSKINTYVDVTKAFFDVLLTEEQLNVLDEDILRLQRNYNDAYSLYQNGLTDNIDYQRTQISLSNTQAQRKSTEEALKGKYSVLKQLIGVAPEKSLTVLYDSSKYENDILIDTAKALDYGKRIEYQQMQTALNLQNIEVGYYRWSFLPTLSAYYDYAPEFGNNQFSDLYNTKYPDSFLGLKISLPIFQGANRLENLSKAKIQYKRLELGMDYLKSEINSEYSTALAAYISNLNELRIAKSNIAIAKNIFNTVKFQYDKGIKAYLEVIVSETDLRTSELNYLNVLFQVLTSKMDLEKALGQIKTN